MAARNNPMWFGEKVLLESESFGRVVLSERFNMVVTDKVLIIENLYKEERGLFYKGTRDVGKHHPTYMLEFED